MNKVEIGITVTKTYEVTLNGHKCSKKDAKKFIKDLPDFDKEERFIYRGRSEESTVYQTVRKLGYKKMQSYCWSCGKLMDIHKKAPCI